MDIDLEKNIGAGAMMDNIEEKVFYLPLIDKDGIPLPLHFLNQFQVKNDCFRMQARGRGVKLWSE